MVSEEQNSDVELASEVIPVPQVQPEAETLEVVNDDENDEANKISHRKPRQRKKVLYNAVLKLMEFYFGDSNLSRDRFLAGLVNQNPDVDLEVFLRFNKIRALTTDLSKIVKALRESQMLKVSDDGTKVRRITPIVEKQNTDECTVYIQRLPSDADHEWLSTLFSEYGPVDYVSIPKFKSSNKIKGFAFVEFKTPEGAEKCLKAFRAKGFELPSQTQPTEVLSITTFTEGEKQDDNGESNNFDVESCANEDVKQKTEKSKAKKRKKSAKSDDPQDSDQSDCTKPKKKKCGEETDKDSSVCQSDSNAEDNKQHGKKRKRKALQGTQDSDTEVPSKEKIKKHKKSQVEETESKKDHDNTESETDSTVNNKESVENADEEDATEKKKKKKRKKKNRAAYQSLEATDMGLQVMGKKDWKRLRNKYLDLQRSKMKQLKQHLRKAQWNQWGNRMDAEPVEASDNIKKNPSSVEFMPGVIVKVELKEACIDPKGFKAELRSNSHVKYVDIKEGSNEAFVRCDSSEAAKELSEKPSNERNFKVLTGDEEKFYWDKITKDRQEKIGNKVRVKQRGRDKLLKKAEKELGKHIKFDEV